MPQTLLLARREADGIHLVLCRTAEGFDHLPGDGPAHRRAAARHIRSLTVMKKGGKADGGDKFAAGFFGNRATKNVMGRAKHIEARIEQILTDEKLEKPGRSWQMKLDFAEPVHKSKDICVAENLTVGYSADAPLLANLNFYIRSGQRIALTGANGTGKTTLLRTMAGKIEPLAGSIRLGTSIKLG